MRPWYSYFHTQDVPAMYQAFFLSSAHVYIMLTYWYLDPEGFWRHAEWIRRQWRDPGVTSQRWSAPWDLKHITSSEVSFRWNSIIYEIGISLILSYTCSGTEISSLCIVPFHSCAYGTYIIMWKYRKISSALISAGLFHIWMSVSPAPTIHVSDKLQRGQIYRYRDKGTHCIVLEVTDIFWYVYTWFTFVRLCWSTADKYQAIWELRVPIGNQYRVALNQVVLIPSFTAAFATSKISQSVVFRILYTKESSIQPLDLRSKNNRKDRNSL